MPIKTKCQDRMLSQTDNDDKSLFIGDKSLFTNTCKQLPDRSKIDTEKCSQVTTIPDRSRNIRQIFLIEDYSLAQDRKYPDRFRFSEYMVPTNSLT